MSGCIANVLLCPLKLGLVLAVLAALALLLEPSEVAEANGRPDAI